MFRRALPKRRRYRGPSPFIRPILFLITLCSLAVPVQASDQFAVSMHLLRPGTAAVADLDGDHVPDVVSGTKTGYSTQGYAYRVDLSLTGNLNSKSFSVFSDEPTGINIEAIDVDGDNDLDLVVTSHLRRDRIEVWLNDGNGRFTRNERPQYDSSVRQQSQFVTPFTSISTHAANLEPRRPQVALEPQRNFFTVFHFSLREFGSGSGHPAEVASASARLRAPPALTIL